MSKITSIAIAGATGFVGPHILKELVDAGFQITVLTRSKRPKTFDSSIKVVEVDFTSVESLTAALRGIDGVVSTVALAAAESQIALIDAAVAAGVNRFIPSEYGCCTTSPKVEALPLYSSMFNIKQYVREKAKSTNLTWTVLACGAFLDSLIDGPMLDLANHKANLFDEGGNRVSATSLANVGKAIAGIFEHHEATKNRIVRISEVIVTQNKLLKIVKGLRPEIQWEISNVRTSVMLKEGLEAISAGDYSAPVFMKIVTGTAFAGDSYGCAYDETDNELLGIKKLTEEDVRKLIATKLT
ncbi:hypothetical protein ACHAO1_011248 [Botrytis cinerea]